MTPTTANLNPATSLFAARSSIPIFRRIRSRPPIAIAVGRTTTIRKESQIGKEVSKSVIRCLSCVPRRRPRPTAPSLRPFPRPAKPAAFLSVFALNGIIWRYDDAPEPGQHRTRYLLSVRPVDPSSLHGGELSDQSTRRGDPEIAHALLSEQDS